MLYQIYTLEDKLTIDNFVDTIYLAIDDKQPIKNRKWSHFNVIIKELEEFGQRLYKIIEKYPDENEKKLKEFIIEKSMQISEVIKLLNNSKLKAPNNTNKLQNKNLQKKIQVILVIINNQLVIVKNIKNHVLNSSILL